MRKKLFAVIMSAMMMITFMPTMAFAVEPDAKATVNWTDNYSKLTVTLSADTEGNTPSYTAKATVVFSSADGCITATAAVPGASDQDFNEQYGTRAEEMRATLTANKTQKFYDLTGATIIFGTSKSKLQSSVTKTVFDGLFEASAGSQFSGLYVVEPSYTTSVKKGNDPEGARVLLSTLQSNNVTLKFPTKASLGYKETVAAQDVTLPVVASVYQAAGNNTLILNGPVSQKVTVKATAADATKAAFFVDDETKGAKITGLNQVLSLNDRVYDGAEHKVVMQNVDGLTLVSCEKLNWKTGSYEKVDAMTYKDATETGFPHTFKAVVKDAKKSATYTISVGVAQAKVKVFIPGTINVYDKASISVENILSMVAESSATAAPVAYRAENAVIAAENKAILAWGAKYYDTGVKTEGIKTFAYISKKADAPADLTEYAYSANVDLTVVEGKFEVKINTVNNDVTAMNQTKTFHVKNAKALKAKKTFKLKGDITDFGTLSYIKKSGNSKIKVASNGTVTVKKGLKKGTYTVKIKVKAAGAKDTKTLKVKIVK